MDWQDEQNWYGCGFGVYLQTRTGATGHIEMLDHWTNTYVGSATFNLPASSNWVYTTVTNSWSCYNWMTIRVVLDNNTNGPSLLIDDAIVNWGFYNT